MAKGTLRVNGVLIAEDIHKIVQESGDSGGGGTGVGDEILLETGFHILTEASANAVIQANTGDNIVIREDDGTAVLTVDTNGRATFTGDTHVGTDDVGHDVKFHGATAGSYMLWDESTDDLVLGGVSGLLAGVTAAETINGITTKVQVEGTDANSSSLSIFRNSADANAPFLLLGKSRGTAVSADTIINQNDTVGQIMFTAADGTDRASQVASIVASIDASPAANDTPGRLIFSTTADGANSVSERMRIDDAGKVGIGTTAPAVALEIIDTGNQEMVAGFGADDDGTCFVSIRTAETQNNLAGLTFSVGTATPTGVSSSVSIAHVVGKVMNSGGALQGELQFHTNDGDSITQKMVITEAGNVGINTTTPAASLDVVGEVVLRRNAVRNPRLQAWVLGG